jgi:hypothetical protein
VSTDAWTTKGKPIHVGDKVIIWKAKGNSDWRGVVALGEVLTDPYLRTAEHRTYYQQNADANKIEERVAIRYIRPPRLPLVMDGDATDVLHNLSVSRATGGTVFRVTPEQWDAVVEAAGGWPNAADHYKDPYSELTEL